MLPKSSYEAFPLIPVADGIVTMVSAQPVIPLISPLWYHRGPGPETASVETGQIIAM